MDLEELNCNNCGAPLSVPNTARYVMCQHCSTQLTVERTDGATFTAQLDSLVGKTEQLQEQVQKLSDRADLESLDREWELRQKDLMITNNEGLTKIPTGSGAIFGGIFAVVVGVGWTILTFSMFSSAPSFGGFGVFRVLFPLFGLVFAAVGGIASVRHYSMAQAYHKALRDYRRRRRELQDADQQN